MLALTFSCYLVFPFGALVFERWVLQFAFLCSFVFPCWTFPFVGSVMSCDQFFASAVAFGS